MRPILGLVKYIKYTPGHGAAEHCEYHASEHNIVFSPKHVVSDTHISWGKLYVPHKHIFKNAIWQAREQCDSIFSNANLANCANH